MIPARLARSNKLDAYEKAVFLYLASLNPSRPSMRRIAKDIGISLDKTRRSIIKLCEMGILIKNPGNTAACNSYETNWSSYQHPDESGETVYRHKAQGVPPGSTGVCRQEVHNHINESEQINQREKLSVLVGGLLKKIPTRGGNG